MVVLVEKHIMKPEEIIERAFNEMIYETTPEEDEWEPDNDWNWAKALIISRIEEVDLKPTEDELYTLMKLRMKV